MHDDDRAGPPLAQRRPFRHQSFGVERDDPYAWLSDRSDPAVLDYLKAENRYCDEVLTPLETYRLEIFEEMKRRIAQTDLSVPVRHGAHWYYQRTEKGFDYPRYYRCAALEGDAPPVEGSRSDEELLIDENLLAAGCDYLEVTNVVVDPRHEILAYAVDRTGGERYALHFEILSTSKAAPIPESIPDTYYGLAWANDSQTVFYTKVDDAMRPFQVWRHRLYTDPLQDDLIFEESDERFNVVIGKTNDERYIVIEASSHTTSESWVLDADDVSTPLRSLIPRRQGIEYSVEHFPGGDTGAGYFVVLTNDEALDFRLIAVPDRDDGTLEGFELLAHRPGTRVEGFSVYATFLVVAERSEATALLRIVPISAMGPRDLQGRALESSWVVPGLRAPGSTFEGDNLEWETTSLRIEQTSLIDPRTVSDLTVKDRSIVVRKRQIVLGEFDPDDYVTYRRLATGADGTAIPISIAHRRDLLVDPDDLARGLTNPAPCLLYGYGSYEHSIDAQFSSLRLSLLERGVVYAIAHVRGGGEGGRRWYLDGKLANKVNTFTDFIAAARDLVAARIADSSRLAARGASAGGLLMGAIRNMAPELFCAIVAEVPFVDVVTTMQDASLPLTIGEYEEWGNPAENESDFKRMLAYSPYDNLASDAVNRNLPAMFVTAGLNDPRVGYFEPAKWVARMRALNPDELVVLRTQLGAGHAGASGRYESWSDEARVFAFLLWQFGLLEHAERS